MKTTERIRLLAVFAVVLLTIVGCNDEVSLLETSSNENHSVIETNPYKVPLEQALIDASRLFRELDSPATRMPRSVKSIDYVVNDGVSTRASNDVDTMLYVVNYSNDEGFAVLGADTRLPSVYAISNEGQINLEDTVDNPGLAMFVNNVKSSLIDGVPGYFPTDSVDWRGHEPLKPVLGERVVTYLEQIKPKLPKYASRWSQGSPYNKSCPIVESQRSPVGCVPLSCAQIMSYYRWPTNLFGCVLNWQGIFDWYGSCADVARYMCPDVLPPFLYRIGLALNAKFEEKLTSVTERQLMDNFTKLGYEAIGNASSLKHSAASAALKNNPILVFGYSTSDSGLNHAWVIDGYLSYKEEWDAIDNPEHCIYRHLYHCVWGYSGDNNGYFLCSDDGTIGLSPYMYDESDSKEIYDKLSGKSFSKMKAWYQFKIVTK